MSTIALPVLCTGELKMGEIGVGIKMINSEKFRYFSIKSNVVDVY